MLHEVAGRLCQCLSLVECGHLSVFYVVDEDDINMVFDDEITEKIISMQDTLNDLLLGDHYRVFLRNKSKR